MLKHKEVRIAVVFFDLLLTLEIYGKGLARIQILAERLNTVVADNS